VKPTMHIELVKMSQFFAGPISNEDKKFVGLNKQVKTEIGLRILEEYGLAELVKKIPFGPFWKPTKKLQLLCAASQAICKPSKADGSKVRDDFYARSSVCQSSREHGN
jgi:hypothetical protein